MEQILSGQIKPARPRKPHLSVCVCTYKRPRLLANLLDHLDGQQTGGLFDYSVTVVDNDGAGSARETVRGRAVNAGVGIVYHIEPRQNIALARNRAVAVSTGDFVAFIDDDEFPGPLWLATLYRAAEVSGAAGVLGPVLPYFETEPPPWVRRGRLFNRPAHASGEVLGWRNTRTGNVLLRRALFEEDPVWFRPEFGSGGEDRDYFRRKIARGHVFIWSNEAPVHEIVPPGRWQAGHLVKRGLLRGKMALEASRSDPVGLAISYAAVLAYAVSLPYLLVMSPLIGFEHFMKQLIRTSDHLGKIAALFRIELVGEKYVTG